MDKPKAEIKEKDIELKEALDKIKWPIQYGNITIQLRDAKVTLLKIERTIKLD